MSIDTSFTSSLRTVRPGESNFCISDGGLQVWRASLEVDNKCPDHWRDIANMMIINGWISPLAVVKDSELFWQEFSK